MQVGVPLPGGHDVAGLAVHGVGGGGGCVGAGRGAGGSSGGQGGSHGRGQHGGGAGHGGGSRSVEAVYTALVVVHGAQGVHRPRECLRPQRTGHL